MADVRPGAGSDVVPIAHELKVETSSGDGLAIAMSWEGTHMLYLVVSATDAVPPRWFYDNDINVAYIGRRPGIEPQTHVH